MKETKFKDTEVGRIPEDWEVKRLGENILFLRTGLNPRAHFKLNTPDADGFYITVRELQGFDIVVDEQTDRINCQAAKRIDERSKLEIGDVLFSGTGTIGQTALVKEKPTNWGIKEGIYAITPNHNKLVSSYLIYYLHTFKAVSLYSSMSSGSTINSVPMTKFVNLPIPLPSLSEQSRIAASLSNIDALIAELDKLIEKKRAIKQGAMQQLLTGKKRLKGFNEPWVEKKLGEDALILRGGSPRPIEDYITDSQDGLNWIKIGDVKPNDKYFRKTAEKIKKEGLSKTRQVKKGDFILSNSMSFGRPYILNIDGCIHDGWLVIQDYQETYDMQFLYYILCSDTVMNQYASMAAGSSVQNLNKEKVANVLLYAPSSLKEQSAIAKVLSSMDEEISFLEAKREKYNAIKQGMMQQLLTGRIRLVETNVKTSTTSANVHFRRSVLAAEIADRLCDEPTFGHVKMEKMLFLAEHCCHIDIGSHYHRDAAGPYDNKALRSIDSQLKKQKWFEVQRTEKGYRYVPMQNRGKHKTYFNRYYSGIVPMFDKIINTFKTQNTERCEIVATLYSAWEDLLHSNKSFTDADIVDEVLNNWHESKKRISQDRWLKAIQWMRENGFAPDNNNK